MVCDGVGASREGDAEVIEGGNVCFYGGILFFGGQFNLAFLEGRFVDFGRFCVQVSSSMVW